MTKSLSSIYSDLVLPVHEPIKENYAPRLLMGGLTPEQLPEPYRTITLNHLQNIELSITPTQPGVLPYVELGWPCYGAIPYLLDRFAGRIKIVHLVREPVRTAFSLATHQFIWDQHTKISEVGVMTPMDQGVRFPQYVRAWESMSQFERCLYFWAEVNALGLSLEEETAAPWLRVSFEEIFDGDGLQRLLDFLELPYRDEMAAGRERREDIVSFPMMTEADPTKIDEYPEIIELAATLGYADLKIDEAALKDIYSKPRN